MPSEYVQSGLCWHLTLQVERLPSEAPIDLQWISENGYLSPLTGHLVYSLLHDLNPNAKPAQTTISQHILPVLLQFYILHLSVYVDHSSPILTMSSRQFIVLMPHYSSTMSHCSPIPTHFHCLPISTILPTSPFYSQILLVVVSTQGHVRHSSFYSPFSLTYYSSLPSYL